MVLAAIAFICAAVVQLQIDVSGKVNHCIQCPHRSAEKISCDVVVVVLFSPENIASLPVVLRDSVEITQHQPEVSERFTAWT